MDGLESINFSANKIVCIPDDIAALRNLHTLDIQHNGIAELPDSIASLTNLEKLDLRLNKGLEKPAWLEVLREREGVSGLCMISFLDPTLSASY